MKHFLPRVTAVAVAASGAATLGVTAYRAYEQKQHFALGGDIGPVTVAALGTVLLLCGIAAFLAYGRATPDARHWDTVAGALRRLRDGLADGALWAVHWGSFALGIGLFAMCFSIRDNSPRFALFFGTSVFCGLLHLGMGRVRHGSPRKKRAEEERAGREHMRREYDERPSDAP